MDYQKNLALHVGLKIKAVLQIASVKILLFLHEKGESRYTQLTKLVASRGTLSFSIKDLEAEGLIKRRLVDAKPIQAYYSLTEKGQEVAEAFSKINHRITE